MKNEDNDIGYLLEVDLHYSKHLHDHHIDYPPAPKIINVKESMASDASKETYRCYNNGKAVRDEKTSKLSLTMYGEEDMLFIFVIKNITQSKD